MDQATQNKIVSFIWGIADDVLRDLKSRGSQQQLLADFEDYLNGFSPNVQDILENFKFRNQRSTLSKSDSPVTRSSDGQMLFLANMASKMNHDTPLGSRIAEVHNGSSLFTGDAGQGESNIRRWLIDATQWCKPLRKNLGNKNCELAPDDIQRICDTHLKFAETPQSKIFPNAAFGYWKVTVERPLRLHSELSVSHWVCGPWLSSWLACLTGRQARWTGSGFMISWGVGVQGEDFEVEFFVEEVAFLLAGGDQQIVGHVEEQAQIAGGVVAESLQQAGTEEFDVAGGFEPVIESVLELLGGQGFQAQTAAKPDPKPKPAVKKSAAKEGEPVKPALEAAVPA